MPSAGERLQHKRNLMGTLILARERPMCWPVTNVGAPRTGNIMPTATTTKRPGWIGLLDPYREAFYAFTVEVLRLRKLYGSINHLFSWPTNLFRHA